MPLDAFMIKNLMIIGQGGEFNVEREMANLNVKLKEAEVIQVRSDTLYKEGLIRRFGEGAMRVILGKERSV